MPRLMLSTVLKRLWRIRPVRMVAWFPTVCLLVALGGYFYSDPMWWDWGEMLEAWGWFMAVLGFLGAACVLLPGALFELGNKWKTKPEWLLMEGEESPPRWKVVVSTTAYIAGVIWVAALVVLWLAGGFF